MSHIQLYRDKMTVDGVFGRLVLPNGTLLYTVEDDWRDNKPRVSCIPSGTYPLVRTIWHAHNIETFEVTEVPGRSRILIHTANTEEDIEGCIGVGLRYGTVTVAKDEDTGELNKVKMAVVDSRAAFKIFMAALSDMDVHTLTIFWAPGLPVR